VGGIWRNRGERPALVDEDEVAVRERGGWRNQEGKLARKEGAGLRVAQKEEWDESRASG